MPGSITKSQCTSLTPRAGRKHNALMVHRRGLPPRRLFRLARIAVLSALAVVSTACGGSTRSWPEGMVPYERLVEARNDSSNWLMYSGAYDGQRYSLLADLDRTNVGRLTQKWVYSIDTPYPIETTPLVVDGVMYLTRPPNEIVALDAETGEERWVFKWPVPESLTFCCSLINRGVAILNDTLYMGTMDARLVAIDARTGREKWNVTVGDWQEGFRISSAPLAVKDLIVTGVALAQEHFKLPQPGQAPVLRGRIDAYDAATGALRWRRFTVPVHDEPGSETWKNGSWALGGGATWMTGSYDPSLNLIYWGVGAPNSPALSTVHPGDNLFTSSILALDADEGRLVWHYQTTPHDTFDWDAAHVLVLADLETAGASQTLLNANRNGFYYVLDRKTGRFIRARPFAMQTWAERIDTAGRPVITRPIAPTFAGNEVAPSMDGATSWWSPSFSPRTALFYVTAHDASEVFLGLEDLPEVDFTKAVPEPDAATSARLQAVSIRRFDPGTVLSAIRALDAHTGELRWEHRLPQRSTPGLLSTAGDLLFTGSTAGDFWALDAHSGKVLWHTRIDGWIHSAPITFRSNGKQIVAIVSSEGLHAFEIAP